MSPTLDSPVQTQMAVTALKNHQHGGSSHQHGGSRSEAKSTGTRRVFVQTETGCVLGMDLDRSDNAHTVKRRLQIALNVSTEESSLTFGDLVLKNDLTAIRNDSPLLLTRNVLHRSSSTPCLSPTGREIRDRIDKGGPIEMLGNSPRFAEAKTLVKEVMKAINNNVEPFPVNSGLGGAYFFRNSKNEYAAIVKPTDEEPYAPNNPKGFVGKTLGQPGLKRSVRVGETGYREVAAYLLDYDHFANVPPTTLVKITHEIFNVNNGVNGKKTGQPVSKIASFQKYVAHDYDASDHGTSGFPVASVHRIGILDIRILNTDRHGGNLLIRKSGQFGQVELYPIDHGLCLPESLEDPYFEWIHWAQAAIPFSEDVIEYVAKLDPVKDCEMLRKELPMIREACLRVLVLCTVFLKGAVANGLCLSEIGEMMSREFRSGEEQPSELEVVCIEVRRIVSERGVLASPRIVRSEDDEFQFDMEENEEYGFGFGTPKMGHGFGLGHGKSGLPRLDEESEGEGEEDEEKEKVNENEKKKISVSMKNMSLGEKKYTNLENSSFGHRSANEQIPASVIFVKVGDMNEEEWVFFMDKFQELINPAFEKRKFVTNGQKQKQRLGTSCQF